MKKHNIIYYIALTLLAFNSCKNSENNNSATLPDDTTAFILTSIKYSPDTSAPEGFNFLIETKNSKDNIYNFRDRSDSTWHVGDTVYLGKNAAGEFIYTINRK